MKLLTALIAASTWPKNARFLEATRYPEAASSAQWSSVIRPLLGASPFWIGRFPNGIPAALESFEITTYEDYRTAIEETFSSGSNVSPLSNEKILFWAKSTGTSAKAKLFPLTASFQKQFQVTTPPFVHSLTKRFDGFMAKPVCYFASTLPSEKSPGGVDIGAMSGFNYQNIRGFLKNFYALPLGVFKDSETFFQWAPLYALATDLSSLFAVTPSMILQFAERLEKQIEDYWPYLEGKKAPPAPLPPLRIDPARLEHLKSALAQRPLSFRTIWPSMQFISCWKGSTCGMQLPKLEPYLHGVTIVDAPYSATEGWMNVPTSTEVIGGPVHPDGHVMEFIAAGAAIEKENLLPAWKLEPGVDYEVFLTTAMGFVRYRLFDIVRCTGYTNRSPHLEFRQKSGSMISLGHTRVSEADLLEALADAELGGTKRWFFGPSADGTHLVFYCDSTNTHVDEAIAAADKALAKLNTEYADDLKTGLLKPIATLVLEGSHAAWAERELQAQSKPTILRQQAP